ncbi:MAG TPA: MarR family transcriptional regulator [Jatrophihabitantaceae bacterium]|nr:MarR family transcriptional regulator [Jatrophihabitantaceae bacterium]
MTDLVGIDAAELATMLRPSLLRLTRTIRNQRADMSITLGQLSALGSLEKSGPISAGELASCERVQPPSMTKVIASLEQRGLVRREAHPTDKRQVIIALTDSGRTLLDSERRSRDAWLLQRFSSLTAAERMLLLELVPVLDKLAEL